MIVETSKGAVSLSGATAVTVKRNLRAYVPKLIGLSVAILGALALLMLVGSAITERAYTPWYGWIFIALLVVLILSVVIGGGLMMLSDPGKETVLGFRVEEDSYTNIIFLLTLQGGVALFIAFLAPPVQGGFDSTLSSAALCFVLAAVVYWSKNQAGKVDATIAYPTHRTTIRALSPYEAEQLTTAFRDRQAAA